jgi:hypothetical protein
VIPCKGCNLPRKRRKEKRGKRKEEKEVVRKRLKKILPVPSIVQYKFTF